MRLLFILSLAVGSLTLCLQPALAEDEDAEDAEDAEDEGEDGEDGEDAEDEDEDGEDAEDEDEDGEEDGEGEPEALRVDRDDAWAPSFDLKEVVRFHVPVSAGVRFGYPESLASLVVRSGADLWLGRVGIEGDAKFSFAFGEGILAEPPTYFRMMGRVGGKGLITLKGPKPAGGKVLNLELSLAIGGGFAGGGVSVNHSELKPTVGAYEFIELLMGPHLWGAAAKTGKAGYLGIRVEQEQTFHPSLDWMEHSTSVLFTIAAVGIGGRTPYFH